MAQELTTNVPIGMMDTDSDLVLVDEKNYRYALNIRNGYGGTLGSCTPVKGNELVSFALPTGTNVCIGTAEEDRAKTVIYFIYNSLGEHLILRYYPNRVSVPNPLGVIERIAQGSVLNFKEEWKINHAFLIDLKLLYWTDAQTDKETIVGNPPRKINIDKGNVTNRPLNYEVQTEIASLFFAVVPTSITITVRNGLSLHSVTIPQVDLNIYQGDPIAFLEFLNTTLTIAPWATWLVVKFCDCKLEVQTIPQAGRTSEFVMSSTSGDVDFLVVPTDHYPITLVAAPNLIYLLEEQHISLIKKPPLCEPTADYTLDDSIKANNVNNAMFQFRTRYWYDDYEKSAWSAISNFPVPLDLDGNFLDILNAIIVDYTEDILASVSWRAILRRVELAFRIGETGQFRTIDFLEICEIGIATNKYTFLYDKLYSVVPSDDAPADPTQQALKHFDNVPRLTGALEFVANREGKGRIFASANLENYNVDDCVDLTVNLDESYVDPCLVTIRGRIIIDTTDVPATVVYDSVFSNETFLANDGFTYILGTVFDIGSGKTVPLVWNGELLQGFVVYLAGTNHFGISKNTVIVPEIERDGTFEIKNVPKGKYIMRVANWAVVSDNANGDIHNINNGIAWQNTSAPVIDCAGSLAATGISSERILDLTAATGVFDLTALAGYGDIIISHVGRFFLGDDLRGTISGYFRDNGAQFATPDERLGAIGCERQKITYQVLTDGALYPSSGAWTTSQAITDHNGFFYFIWKYIHNGGGLSVNERMRVKNLYPTVPDGCLSSFRDLNQAYGSNFVFVGDLYVSGLEGLYLGFEVLLSKNPADAIKYDLNGEIRVSIFDTVDTPLLLFNPDTNFTLNNKTLVQGTVVEANNLGVQKALMCIERNGRQEQTDANGNYAISVYCPWDKFVRDDDTLFPQYLLDKCYDYPPTPLFHLLNIDRFCVNYTSTIPYEVPDFAYGFSGALTVQEKYLKSGGSYRTGIVYEDYYNRKSTVVEGSVLHIPFHTERGVYGKVFTSWEINGVPPIWAHHFRIVRTRDGFYRRYLQLKIQDIDYVRITDVNATPVITSYANGDATNIMIKVTALFDEDTDSEAVLWFFRGENGGGYAPEPRDRIRFVLDENDALVLTNGIYDFEIQGKYVDANDDYWLVFANVEIFREIFPGWLIEVYTPKRTEEVVFYECGECHLILDPYTSNRRHSGPMQNQIIGTQPAKGLLVGGDTYWRIRQFAVSDGSVYNLAVENRNMSDRFDSINEDIGRANIEDLDFGERFYYNKISYSDLFVPGTKKNGLSGFIGTDFQMTDVRYGIIKNLIYVGDVLLAVCEFKIQPFYVGKDNVLQLSGREQIGRSDRTMNPANELIEDWGTQHPGSIASDGNYVYGFDARQGVAWRYATNGLTEISQYGFVKEFNAIGKLFAAKSAIDYPICSIFDREYRCFILTFPAIDSTPAQSISFDELKNGWNTYLSHLPETYGITGQVIVAFKDGQIWVHESSNVPFANFFGVQHDCEVDIVVNKYPKATKLFMNIELQSNKKFWSPIITIPANEDYPLGMLSELRPNRFGRTEGHYNADFLRDKLDTEAAFVAIVDPVLRATTALLKGRPLRGEAAVVKLRLENAGENFNLKRIDTKFVFSEETKK